MGFVGSNIRTEERKVDKIGDGSSKQLKQSCGQSIAQSENNIRQVLMSAPCSCRSTSPNYESLDTTNSSKSNMTNTFVGPYQNYDVPRTATQQVTIRIKLMLE